MIRRRDNIVDTLLERKNIALISLIAILTFALLYTPVRNSLTGALYSVAPGIWEKGGNLSDLWNSFLINFQSKETLARENETLHTDILRMQALVLDRNLLNEKVNTLEGLLGRAQSDNRVLGNVISGPAQSPYDTLIIDIGTDNGVALGNDVVYAGTGVIGTITEVLNKTAKVKLYSFPGEVERVYLGPRSIPANAVGKGMGNFVARVPQGSAVNIGDNVITANGRLLIGTVSAIENEPTLPFVNIFFRLPFNITEIVSVEVIVNK